MIAHTHRVVGEFLYHQLSEELQSLLNRRCFVYGNVKPDIAKDYRKMSHYYRDNRDVIFNMLQELLTQEQSIDSLSENLGILIHFFCDYTCVYHANDYVHDNHSIRLHMQYETKLHFYTIRQLKVSHKIRIIPFQSIQEIYDYVEQLTKEINQEQSRICVEFDFNQMVTLSLSVTLYVLNQIIQSNLLVNEC